MKFAYADPPYFGCARRFYDNKHDRAANWDKIETHISLTESLISGYPDGWAMSLNWNYLRHILPICPDKVRIAAWVKSYAVSYPGVRVSYSWEPVIWMGGRKGYESDPEIDWVMANAPVVVPGKSNFPGKKPRKFCRWIFSMLGAKPGDTLDDIFPGSGAVGAAWAEYVGEKSPLPRLPLEEIAWAGVEE